MIEILLWIGWIIILVPSFIIFLYAIYTYGVAVLTLLYEIPGFKKKFEDLEVLFAAILGLIFSALGIYFYFEYNFFVALALIMTPLVAVALISYFRE